MRLSNDFIELESFVTKLIIFGLSLLLIFCTCHFLAYWMVIFWFLCEFFWGMCLHFTELVQYTLENNGLFLAKHKLLTLMSRECVLNKINLTTSKYKSPTRIVYPN